MNLLKSNSILLVIITLLITLGTTSCEQENWMDWKLQNELWLENNSKKEGVTTTHTGLQYEVVSPGETLGKRPNTSSFITVTYAGQLIDGSVFDQTAANKTASFYLYDMILGWQEGLRKIYEKGTIRLYIPYNLAYGDQPRGVEGNSGFIPPYSTLIFEVHLSGVN